MPARIKKRNEIRPVSANMSGQPVRLNNAYTTRPFDQRDVDAMHANQSEALRTFLSTDPRVQQRRDQITYGQEITNSAQQVKIAGAPVQATQTTSAQDAQIATRKIEDEIAGKDIAVLQGEPQGARKIRIDNKFNVDTHGPNFNGVEKDELDREEPKALEEKPSDKLTAVKVDAWEATVNEDGEVDGKKPTSHYIGPEFTTAEARAHQGSGTSFSAINTATDATKTPSLADSFHPPLPGQKS